MKQLSIRELRSELPHIDDLLRHEGEILITRRGTPIARVLPIRTATKIPSHADLRARVPRLVRGSEEYIRADRDER
ncbi:MAG TPA: type II toxin-antitoxin system prevent-host-death family antitoxin [Gammaproteobacteria bacterium]|jgi:prevent-host-death family protein|nr:type II toxin-antitoxin system prevent-host-death family antitoxin [Gammaproteobacteria bacterium]